MMSSPVTHHTEEHQTKTMCYECPWCGHAEIFNYKFEQHVERHDEHDIKTFRLDKHLVTGLAPFRALYRCTVTDCSFRTHTITTLATHHAVEHVPAAARPAQSQSRAPYKSANVYVQERIEQLEHEMATLQGALKDCKDEEERRRLEPEVLGVKHVVALRGDFVTNRAAAYAHMFIELFVTDGDYTLINSSARVDVTIRKHHACPALVQHQISQQTENPKFFKLQGLLHTARGTPVVWYTMCLRDTPRPGEWHLVNREGKTVSRVTVDCLRVLQ